MFDFEDYVYIFVHRVFVYLLTDLTDYHFKETSLDVLLIDIFIEEINF